MYQSIAAGLSLLALAGAGCSKDYDFTSQGGSFEIEIDGEESWAKYNWFREQNGKRADLNGLGALLFMLDADNDGEVTEEELNGPLKCERRNFLDAQYLKEKDSCILYFSGPPKKVQ